MYLSSECLIKIFRYPHMCQFPNHCLSLRRGFHSFKPLRAQDLAPHSSEAFLMTSLLNKAIPKQCLQ